jgi:large subunit ribosomal protein L23
MALFGKKDAVVETTSEAVTKVAKAPRGMAKNVSAVIVKPRITEKAALLTDKNVYTFEIKKGASKYDVRDAIKALYKVTPVKVHIVNKQPRHSMSRMRGRDMMENGLRKAYVYLKKGDRIELV